MNILKIVQMSLVILFRFIMHSELVSLPPHNAALTPLDSECMVNKTLIGSEKGVRKFVCVGKCNLHSDNPPQHAPLELDSTLVFPYPISECVLSNPLYTLETYYGELHKTCIPYKTIPERSIKSQADRKKHIGMAVITQNDLNILKYPYYNHTSYYKSMIVQKPIPNMLGEKISAISTNAISDQGQVAKEDPKSYFMYAWPRVFEAVKKKAVEVEKSNRWLVSQIQPFCESLNTEARVREVSASYGVWLQKIEDAIQIIKDIITYQMVEVETAMQIQTTIINRKTFQQILKIPEFVHAKPENGKSAHIKKTMCKNLYVVSSVASVFQSNAEQMEYALQEICARFLQIVYTKYPPSPRQSILIAVARLQQQFGFSMADLNIPADLVMHNGEVVKHLFTSGVVSSVYRLHLHGLSEFSMLVDDMYNEIVLQLQDPAHTDPKTAPHHLAAVVQKREEMLKSLTKYLISVERHLEKVTAESNKAAAWVGTAILSENNHLYYYLDHYCYNEQIALLGNSKHHVINIEGIDKSIFEALSLEKFTEEDKRLFKYIVHVLRVLHWHVQQEDVQGQKALLENLAYTLNGLQRMADEFKTCPAFESSPANTALAADSGIVFPDLAYKMLKQYKALINSMQEEISKKTSDIAAEENIENTADYLKIQEKIQKTQEKIQNLKNTLKEEEKRKEETRRNKEKARSLLQIAYQNLAAKEKALQTTKTLIDTKKSVLKELDQNIKTFARTKEKITETSGTINKTAEEIDKTIKELQAAKNTHTLNMLIAEVLKNTTAPAPGAPAGKDVLLPDIMHLASPRLIASNPELMAQFSKMVADATSEADAKIKEIETAQVRAKKCKEYAKDITVIKEALSHTETASSKARADLIGLQKKEACETKKSELVAEKERVAQETTTLSTSKKEILQHITAALDQLIHNLSAKSIILDPQAAASLALHKKDAPLERMKSLQKVLETTHTNIKDQMAQTQKAVDTCHKKKLAQEKLLLEIK